MPAKYCFAVLGQSNAARQIDPSAQTDTKLLLDFPQALLLNRFSNDSSEFPTDGWTVDTAGVLRPRGGKIGVEASLGRTLAARLGDDRVCIAKVAVNGTNLQPVHAGVRLDCKPDDYVGRQASRRPDGARGVGVQRSTNALRFARGALQRFLRRPQARSTTRIFARGRHRCRRSGVHT